MREVKILSFDENFKTLTEFQNGKRTDSERLYAAKCFRGISDELFQYDEIAPIFLRGKVFLRKIFFTPFIRRSAVYRFESGDIRALAFIIQPQSHFEYRYRFVHQ